MEMQNQNRDELYLFAEYDPQPYFCKLLDTDTFGHQITSQLFTALEEHNRLPSVILVVIGNSDIDSKVLNPEHTRRVWSALFSEMTRMIKTRKEDLPRKARVSGEPRVLIANMFPKFKDHNDSLGNTHESFKTKRRRFNGLLPEIARKFEFGVLPITGILPEKSELFTLNNGKLNGKGMKQYWISLSSELKVEDNRQIEKNKNSVISEYFQQQRELRRIDQERKKVARDRFSLPRNMSFRNDQDRGDGSTNRQNRSKSVPSQNKAKNNKRRR